MPYTLSLSNYMSQTFDISEDFQTVPLVTFKALAPSLTLDHKVLENQTSDKKESQIMWQFSNRLNACVKFPLVVKACWAVTPWEITFQPIQ
jgi:hypothetical protein